MPTPNFDQLAVGRHDVLVLLRAAELHAGARRHADRPHPEPQRHDDRRVPGPGRRPARCRVDARLRPQDRGLPDLLHRKVAPGRGATMPCPPPRATTRWSTLPLSPATPIPMRDPTWFPGMIRNCGRCSTEVTKGSLSGKAGEPATEDFKVNGQYVDTPDQGVVGIPFLDGYVEQAALEFLEQAASPDAAVLHQRQLHEGASAESSGTGVRAQVAVQDQVRRLGRRARCAHRPCPGQARRAGPRAEHAGVLHDRQRRLAGRLSGCRLHPVPRHQGHGPRRRQPRSRDRGWPGKSSRSPRATTSSAVST